MEGKLNVTECTFAIIRIDQYIVRLSDGGTVSAAYFSDAGGTESGKEVLSQTLERTAHGATRKDFSRPGESLPHASEW